MYIEYNTTKFQLYLTSEYRSYDDGPFCPPPSRSLRVEKNPGPIGLNNCEITKFRDFACWSQKSRLGEIGQNLKVFLSISVMKSG